MSASDGSDLAPEGGSDAEDSESLSRRDFLQRIRRGLLREEPAEGREEGPSPSDGGGDPAEGSSSADEGSGSPEDSSDSSGSAALDPATARRRLEQLGVSILPLSAGEDRLQVQCKRVGEEFGDEDARLLAPLADRIAWLDLASTAVTDDALEVVGRMTELERLYLQNTAVGSEGLAHLTELDQLEYLNLYGTAVDDAAVQIMESLEGLRTVYLWQTNVTESGARRLRESRSQISVEFGGAGFD